MKLINIKILFALIITGSLLSCEKHLLDKDPVVSPYVIEFSSPVSGAVYNFNDSISIKGRAIYTSNIHGYDIIIRALNDTTTYYRANVHEHNDTLLIDHKWKNELAGHREMEAEVLLYLDHEGNTGSKKVRFTLQ